MASPIDLLRDGDRVLRGYDVGAGGDVVVLLHPYPLHAGTFEADAEALATSGLRALAPSMRGFGGSTLFAGEAPSIDAMADDVAAVLDARGVRGPVVVCGISMGGYVALAFARRHASRLRGLVLADTRAEPDSDASKKSREGSIARVRGGDLAGYLESLLPVQLGETTRRERPDVVDRVRALTRDTDPRAIVQAQEALRDRPDARPGLASLRVPTSVLVGAEDTVTPPDVVRPLADAIAGASFDVVPGAAHFPNLEQPEAFRSAVVRLVERA